MCAFVLWIISFPKAKLHNRSDDEPNMEDRVRATLVSILTIVFFNFRVVTYCCLREMDCDLYSHFGFYFFYQNAHIIQEFGLDLSNCACNVMLGSL